MSAIQRINELCAEWVEQGSRGRPTITMDRESMTNLMEEVHSLQRYDRYPSREIAMPTHWSYCGHHIQLQTSSYVNGMVIHTDTSPRNYEMFSGLHRLRERMSL